MTDGSLMKVESIAEYSKGSILQYFDLHSWSILQYFDLHKAIIGLENQFCVFESGVLHRFKYIYVKCSKILNTFLALFLNKMLIIKAGIHQIFFRRANREDAN